MDGQHDLVDCVTNSPQGICVLCRSGACKQQVVSVCEEDLRLLAIRFNWDDIDNAGCVQGKL